MPNCQNSLSPNGDFLESLLHDAQRFSKYVGKGGIQDMLPASVLSSALHLEMKLWEPKEFKYPSNSIYSNSWEVMRVMYGASSFTEEEKTDLFKKICDLPPADSDACLFLSYDRWQLDLMVGLRQLGISAARNPVLADSAGSVSALASYGRAQKLINIFLKYELCWQIAGVWEDGKFHHYGDLKVVNLRAYLCCLHAPVDSILINCILDTPVGKWFVKKGLLQRRGDSPLIQQSSNGEMRPWTKLDCLRTYYGLQLILRKLAMATWQEGCGCEDAIEKSAKWFNKKYPRGDGVDGLNWIDIAKRLDSKLIVRTFKELEGNRLKAGQDRMQEITERKNRDGSGHRGTSGTTKKMSRKDQQKTQTVKKPSDDSCLSIGCRIWAVLPEYLRKPVILPTWAGRGENLSFQYCQSRDCIRVWQENGNADFEVKEAEFARVCRRYRLLASQGNLAAGQFTDPLWSHPPLGRVHTPWVAPLIRSILQRNAELQADHECCTVPKVG